MRTKVASLNDPIALGLRHELSEYLRNKPNKVPPADSRTRPALAALWKAAQCAMTKRKSLRTFTYRGNRFGIVYLGGQLCVLDLGTRFVMVRPPTSFTALDDVLNSRLR